MAFRGFAEETSSVRAVHRRMPQRDEIQQQLFGTAESKNASKIIRVKPICEPSPCPHEINPIHTAWRGELVNIKLAGIEHRRLNRRMPPPRQHFGHRAIIRSAHQSDTAIGPRLFYHPVQHLREVVYMIGVTQSVFGIRA